MKIAYPPFYQGDRQFLLDLFKTLEVVSPCREFRILVNCLDHRVVVLARLQLPLVLLIRLLLLLQSLSDVARSLADLDIDVAVCGPAQPDRLPTIATGLILEDLVSLKEEEVEPVPRVCGLFVEDHRTWANASRDAGLDLRDVRVVTLPCQDLGKKPASVACST